MSAELVDGPRTPAARPPGAGLVPHRLPVLGATATARTGLAAFHRALTAVGLGHYNLVRLSSVIPPGTAVGVGRVDQGPALPARWRDARPDDVVDGHHGDRVYCVYAEHGTDVPGEQVWAGVGWAQRVDGQGGFFVEHHGPTPEAVTTDIRTSLEDMTTDEVAEFAPPEWVLEGVVCEGDPVCALVVVPYAVVGW
ncbi:pyruvoyl-dependent arginine decarboxylase [Microlunatus antarcticus]|uniref:Pyruvoyl-dependent arginine decarboxylase AaxB n=1 Tax=Microlunatus antarcticus TaxID=53388 RepID=A0A7W5P8P1_9ACTN|nr:arginine decarboxylase [Microlunatus antarcticus]